MPWVVPAGWRWSCPAPQPAALPQAPFTSPEPRNVPYDSGRRKGDCPQPLCFPRAAQEQPPPSLAGSTQGTIVPAGGSRKSCSCFLGLVQELQGSAKCRQEPHLLGRMLFRKLRRTCHVRIEVQTHLDECSLCSCQHVSDVPRDAPLPGLGWHRCPRRAPARLGAHPKAEGGAQAAGTALPSSTPLRVVHMPSLPRTHRLDSCVGQASSSVCPSANWDGAEPRGTVSSVLSPSTPELVPTRTQPPALARAKTAALGRSKESSS